MDADGFALPAARSTVRPRPPYTPPAWSSAPPPDRPGEEPPSLEVVKGGAVVGTVPLSAGRSHFMVGRQPNVDVVVQHASVSRGHAVLQFGAAGELFLFDMGSTHGTFVNRSSQRVPQREYVRVHVGDVIRFGESSRLFVVQGPERMRPPEKPLRTPPAPRGARAAEAKEKEVEERAERIRRAREDMMHGVGGGKDDAVEGAAAPATGPVVPETSAGFSSMPGLSDKQRAEVVAIAARERNMDNVQREWLALRAKEDGGQELSDGQRRRLASLQEKLVALDQQLADKRERLARAIHGKAFASRARRAGDGGGGRGGGDDDDDDDEFYDRTRAVSAVAAAPVAPAVAIDATDEAVAAAVEGARAELAAAERRLAAAVADAALAEGGAEDELDAYMSSVNGIVREETQQRLTAEAGAARVRLAAVEAEAERRERMRKLSQVRARPAAPTAAAAAAAGSLAATMARAQELGRARADTEREERLAAQQAEDEVTAAKEAKRREEEERVRSVLQGGSGGDSLVRLIASSASGTSGELPLAADTLQAMAAAQKRRRDEGRGSTRPGPGQGPGPGPGRGPKRHAVDGSDDAGANWVPPAQQTGDGRTHLNDRFGY